MAQINIPESIGRKLFYTYFSLPEDYIVVDVRNKNIQTELVEYLKEDQAYVVKPDYTISKRGKNNLLAINVSKQEVLSFLELNKGRKYQDFELHRFLIMPFVPHSEEYYVAFNTESSTDTLMISTLGGIDIESNWSQIQHVTIPLDQEFTFKENDLPGEVQLPNDKKENLIHFITTLYGFFKEYGFTFLEINPLTFVGSSLAILDFKGKLDDCTFFHLQKKIDLFALLETIEEGVSEEENYIKKLDSLTGASLKLKVLNRNGKIWPMISGGGASIIYFDALVERGYMNDIAFYGEYSGNPSEELTYEYAKTIIKMMIKSTASKKTLLIAGANANFTDIAKTFRGIERVLIENNEEINKQEIRILIRRGGPHTKEAFLRMSEMAKTYSLQIELESTETDLLHILDFIE